MGAFGQIGVVFWVLSILTNWHLAEQQVVLPVETPVATVVSQQTTSQQQSFLQAIPTSVPTVVVSPTSVPTITRTITSESSAVATVLSYFPSSIQGIMARIIQCESSGNQYAVNPYSGAFTMLQMLPFWATQYGYTVDEVKNSLELTGYIGRKIYDTQGLSAWACY